MSEWATAAIAVGPAMVAGAVGYLGARLQYEGVRTQSEMERARLRDQHAEEHLRHRQAVYHDLLDAIRQAHQTPPRPHSSEQVWQDWAVNYSHHLNAVVLFGTEAVRAGAGRYNDLLYELAKEAGDVGVPGFDAVFQTRIDDFAKRYRELVDAMRADVTQAAGRRGEVE